MKSFVIATCVVAAWSANATAAEIKVLSAGAVEPGLVRAVEAFKKASGTEVKIQFNTAPQLAKKLADDGRTMLGRVGAGVVIRANATPPDISTTEALKQAVLAADSIVYNTAS